VPRLSDAELVSLLLRSGLAGSNAVDVARHAIARFGGLGGLLAASAPSVIGARVCPARAAVVASVIELARRSLAQEAAARDVLTSPQAVGTTSDYLSTTAPTRSSRSFLDSQNRVLAAEELFRGTLAQTSVYPREVVKAALAHNAAAMIFAQPSSGVAEQVARTSC
jgi:DNA repair protein RadC